MALTTLLFFIGALWTASGQLYGFSMQNQLVSVSPSTGKLTPVGPVLADELVAQQLSSIDDAQGLYYLVAFNATSQKSQLLALSLASGTIKLSITLPFAAEEIVGAGQAVDVVPGTADVLVSGRESDGLHHVYRLDTKTQALRLLAKVGQLDVLGGPSAYDPKHDVVWLQFGNNSGIYNYAFDATTGRALHVLPDYLNLETMSYDPVKELIVGVGLTEKDDDYVRVLVELDSVSGDFHVVGTIPGYFLLDAGIGVIDYTSRRLYSYLQPKGNSSAPMDLVTVDLNSGAVVGHVTACVAGASCPWSTEFHNKPTGAL